MVLVVETKGFVQEVGLSVATDPILVNFHLIPIPFRHKYINLYSSKEPDRPEAKSLQMEPSTLTDETLGRFQRYDLVK